MKPALYAGALEAAPPPIAIKPRPPLPPWDPDSVDAETGAPLPVYTELREEPPASAVNWWRGDAWGITIPGLPLVPGGASGPAQDRVLTYFLDRYRGFEERIIEAHLERGYTHISLSPTDSFANGQSEDDYVAMSVRCRRAGLNVHHLMRSKYYPWAAPSATTAKTKKRPKWDPTLNRLRDQRNRPPLSSRQALDVLDGHVLPPTIATASSTSGDLDGPNTLIERLLSEGALQVETPAWEMNYCSPEEVRAMIDHDAALIGTRCRIMLHFFPHYISWQANDETPTDFWNANYSKVDGVLYQCDPSWTAGMMAARATDCLDRLCPGGLWGLSDSGRGHPIDFTIWETIATKQFNNDHDGDGRLADEDIGNLKGYECGNAPGRMIAKGFDNGGRLPDGMPL